MIVKMLLLVVSVLLKVSTSTLGASNSEVEQCLDSFVDLSLLQFRANRFGAEKAGSHMDEETRIVSSIVFECNTTITSVILGIDVRPEGRMRRSFPSVQLWRPTGENQNYKLVAGSERPVVYTPANVSRTGVYEYQLIPAIDVKSGDRIAISQPKQGKSVVRCYILNNIDFDSYRVDFEPEMELDLSGSPINNHLVLIYPVTESPYCVNSPFNASYIKQQSLLITDTERINNQRQILYPEMDFKCNGSVIKWIYGGTSRTVQNNQPPVELQIWQRTGSNANSYIKRSFSQVIANEIKDGSNVHEFYPATPIEFMEGDVFGLFQPKMMDSEVVILAQRESGPNNYRVNAKVDQASNDLVLSELKLEGGNDFPLVSLEISIAGVHATSLALGMTTSLLFLPSGTVTTSMAKSLAATTIAASNERNTLIMSTKKASRTASGSTDEHMSTEIGTPSTASNTATVSTESIGTDTPTFINPIASSSNDINQSTTSNIAIVGTESIGTDTPTYISLIASPSNDINLSLKNANNDDLTLIGTIIVTVFLLMLTVIVCTVIIVIILLWKKKMESNHLPMDTQDRSLSNPIYQSNIGANSEESHTTIPDEYEQQFKPSYHQPQLDSVNNILYDEIKQQNLSWSLDDQYNILKWNIVVPTLDQRRRISEGYASLGEAVDSIYSCAGSEITAHSHNLLLNSNQQPLFEENNFYWTPAMDYESLYEQLASKRFREILVSQIRISGTLGSGNFGKVLNGSWKSPDGPLSVAVKTLKESVTEEEKIKFLQEAAIMGQFHHPNIVKIFGVVTLQEPFMIVLELIHNGDLKQYLETLKPVPGEMVAPKIPELLLDFCRQISSALEYLSKKCFVHRDIAAKNVLVTEEKICKISDFGLSRDLQDETYYVSKGGQLPIKWTAPEALLYKKFSTASDVWSFGVLMYEIWSLGEKPFQNMTNQQTFGVICDGYRLPPPSGCPRAMYEIMMQCWHPKTGERPSFSKLVTDLLQPDDQLLNIQELHQQKFVLGASLEVGQDVYLDLQNMYKSHKIN